MEGLNVDPDGIDSPEKSAQDILDKIEEALKAQMAEITRIIKNNEGKEQIQEIITSVVRSEIITSLKEESQQYHEALGKKVSTNLKRISDIKIPTKELISGLDNIMDVISDIIALIGGPKVKGIAVLVKTLGPVLNKIINLLFGKSDEEIAEKIGEEISEKIFAPILQDLRSPILEMVTENQALIRKQIEQEALANMENFKSSLQEKIKDERKAQKTVEEELATLSQDIEDLQIISASL